MSIETDEIVIREDNGSPGSRLFKAREALGLSPKSVADDLYLPRNYIVWIEEGAYEKLPSMVFCRGYIRSYAKMVGENGEELVALLDSVYGNENIKAPLVSVSKMDQQVKVGDPVMKWSTLLFIIVICGAVFWWWKTQYGLVIPFQSAQQESLAVETADGNELVLPSLDNDLAIIGDAYSEPNLSVDELVSEVDSEGLAVDLLNSDVTDSDEPQLSGQVNQGSGIELDLNISSQTSVEPLAKLEAMVNSLEPTADQLLAQQSNDPAPVSNSDGAVAQLLRIKFNNECWITIKNASGKTLFNGIKKSGEQISLAGDQPLKVSIGRVDSVSEITFGGQAVNLSPLTRNNIANFNLPL
ncbi:RodZ domain-containing protein [Gammaproteobacteria bacterium AS21]